MYNIQYKASIIKLLSNYYKYFLLVIYIYITQLCNIISLLMKNNGK